MGCVSIDCLSCQAKWVTKDPEKTAKWMHRINRIIVIASILALVGTIVLLGLTQGNIVSPWTPVGVFGGSIVTMAIAVVLDRATNEFEEKHDLKKPDPEKKESKKDDPKGSSSEKSEKK